MVKKLPANAGDVSLNPGSERSPGEEKGNPLQSSCLGNPMNRGAWQTTVYGVAVAARVLGGHVVDHQGAVLEDVHPAGRDAPALPTWLAPGA